MFDYRDAEILKSLINHQSLSISALLNRLEISKRVFYYAFSKINQFLALEGYQTIKKTKDTIELSDPLTLNFIKDFMEDNLINHYIYTQEERLYLSILMIASDHDPIKIQDLMDHFLVSKNTIMNDLKDLRNHVFKYNISLEAHPLNGYKLKGPRLRIRALVIDALMHVSEKMYLLKPLNITLLSVQTHQNTLSLLENHFKMALSPKMKDHLSLTLTYLIHARIKPIEDDLLKTLFNQPIYHTAKERLSDALKHEAYFIFLHYEDIKRPLDYPIDQDYLNALTHDFIDTFKAVTSISFKEEAALFEGLRMHLKQSLLRYEYAVMIENTLKEAFIKQYYALYQMTKKVTNLLKDSMGYQVSDDDVVYIAMHFGGHLRRENKVIQFKKVLFICEGVNESCAALKQRIEDAIDFIEITSFGNRSVLDQVTDYDAIITMVNLYDLPIEKPVYFISNAFNEVDKTYLYHAFLVKENPVNSQKIMETIKPFIQDKDYDTIKAKIQALYQPHKPITLSNYLTLDTITFIKQIDSIKKAIDLVSYPLLKNQKITHDYVLKAYDHFLQNPTAMHVLEDVLIIHARPEEGAREDGLSYLGLEKAIQVGSIKVKHIFMLAGKDHNSHLELLSLLSAFLDNHEAFLKQVSSVKKFVDYLNNHA